MIFGKSDRFSKPQQSEFTDYNEFCKARYLMSKGASLKTVKAWFSKKKSQSHGKNTAVIQPQDIADELNQYVAPRAKAKHRVSVEKATVRDNIPYYYPEGAPGPGAYQVHGTLEKPSHNRRADQPIDFKHKTLRQDFEVPMSLEDFEKTHLSHVANGSYLNHQQKYRSVSAPSSGRRPAETNKPQRAPTKYFKPKYNPIVDLENCPSDALLGRWSSVHMDSYQWNTKAYGRRGATLTR